MPYLVRFCPRSPGAATQLIRDGARLVEKEADIFSELGHLGPAATRTPQIPGFGLRGHAARLDGI